MKKVAIVVGNISSAGGTERAVTNMVNTLCENNYTFTIISIFSKPEARIFYKLDSQVDIIHLGYEEERRIKRYFIYLKVIKQLELYIRIYKYNIIIGTGHQFNCIISILGRHVRTIAWEHFVHKAVPLFSRTMMNIFYRKLDCLIVLTSGELNSFKNVPDNKKYVVPNITSFECIERPNLDSKRIIVVGRLERIKSLDSVLRVAKLLKPKFPDWRIDIFGSGQEQAFLEKMIIQMDLSDYVKINQPTDNIKDEYLKSSMILLTSMYEAYPMVLIEAQCCGLPIVSFDCPNGPREIVINGRNGYLIEDRNVEKMTEMIVELISDPLMMNEFSIAAKEDSKRFRKEKIRKKWVSILEKVDKNSNEIT